MELISPEQRRDLVLNSPDLRKIELRDYYASDGELLRAWESGDHQPAMDAARSHADEITADAAKGWEFWRVRIVSEPTSRYQDNGDPPPRVQALVTFVRSATLTVAN
ncbi:DUF6879 family protein [Actinocorallia longicatena]|uniref:DUF6879 domain-containing protein n=1 Tax=Actinocorallia longicatena TaxID=111803 RepID=A0ABP6Q2C4_9ACTN